MKIKIIDALRFKKSNTLNFIGAVTVLNIILSVAAFFKDILFAAYFGTSYQSDALMLAYFIPDNIGNNLLAASIGISCVPVFSALFINEKKDRFYRAIRNISVYFLTFSVILILTLFIFKNQIVSLIGNGFDPANKALCNKLFIIILPAILIYPLVTIGNSVMQVMNRFKIPAAAPILYNLIFLFSIVIPLSFQIHLVSGVYYVSIGIVLGIFSMLLLTAFSLSETLKPILKLGNIIRSFVPSKEELKDIMSILSIFLPYVFIMSTSMAVLFIERYIASGFAIGTISGLNYVYRLTQFPVWVFAAAVSVVILPFMSRAKGVGREEELKKLFGKSLRLMIIISIPIAILLYVFRIPILTILFKHGAFNSESLKITSDLMAGYSIAIVGQSMMFICLRYFIAVGKMLYPLIVFIFTAIVNIIVDFYIIGILGAAGLGYSAALCSFLNSVIIILIIKKMIGFNPKLQVKQYLKVVIANGPVFLIVFFANRIWSFFENKGFLQEASFVAVTMLMAALVYILMLRVCKILGRII